MSHLYFEIQADDMPRAQHFYKSLFGWSFRENPHAPVEYYSIETGGPRGGLFQRPSETPPECGSNAFVCSVEVNDFDQTAKKIKSLGDQVTMPKFAVPGVC